jgi:hypothetical protein
MAVQSAAVKGKGPSRENRRRRNIMTEHRIYEKTTARLQNIEARGHGGAMV